MKVLKIWKGVPSSLGTGPLHPVTPLEGSPPTGSAQIRQSRPDSGLCSLLKSLKHLKGILGDSRRDDFDVVVVQVELRDVLQIHYLHTRHILLSLLLFLDYNYQTRYLYSQTPLIIFTIKPVIMTFKLSIITFKTVQQNSNHQVIIEA